MPARPLSPAKNQETLPVIEPEALSFEQILERLEGVVGELERGELPLEQALAAFERGVMLSRKGAERLDDAERRIEVLLSDGEGLALRPLDKESDDE
jgi:exodeoxyribonuclease VII small subunit